MQRKILIVEDDRELSDLMRSTLQAVGYAVETAADGLDALKKATSHNFDLILLDLVLPELDGFSVCEKLRKRPGHVPIIMVTGLSTQLNRLAGLESGADDYIAKPFSLEHLLTRIQELLTQPPALAGNEPQAGPQPRGHASPSSIEARRPE